MEITIRGYEKKDWEALRDICHKTATDPKYMKNKDLVAGCFIEPYMEFAPGNVVVAANENNEAIGYCISAPDSKAFYKFFRENYLKRIWKMHKVLAAEMFLTPVVTCRYLKKYPAHLHIDILDGYQRMGVGHRLMNEQMRRLKEQKIPGAFLTVSTANEKGVPFYKKYGFKIIQKLPGALVFAMDLREQKN